MTDYSLRARMMILILAPTVLIGLLSSTFFVAHCHNDLQRQLEDVGASIIEPLVVSSEYGMNLQNRESIGQLISVLHRRHSEIVRVISAYDSHNRLSVTSSYQLNPSELQIPKGEVFLRYLSVIRDGDIMILCTSIVSESYSPDGSPESGAKMPGNMLGYVVLELNLKSVRLQQYKEIFISSVMMLFCIGIALIFGQRLIHDVTGLIRNVVSTAGRIRRGQLDSRVEGFMFGELDMLKDSVNSMAMSLAAYHEETQHNVDQATSDLRETLEQMEIQNAELDLAKKRAQKVARIKSEFPANMSHEPCTPLSGVIGLTCLMLKTDLNVTQHDHLTIIERSADNLLATINDMLGFSKLEAEKLTLESTPFLLRILPDEVVTLLAYSTHDKGLELTLNIKNNVSDNVTGGPLCLQQIVTDPVGNATRFTEHGNIDVLVKQWAISNSRVQIEIQIHDTGIGIPERGQSRLFQAFHQVDVSISRRRGGTGLGLVITQRLVKEMGGGILFYSQPNRGSTLWFHTSLDPNPNAIPDILNTDGPTSKRLAYVEANAAAAQCMLEMLAATPLEVIYSPTFSPLAEVQYDILLVGIPVSMRDLSLYREKSVRVCAMSDNVLFALPCHAQVSVEALKRDGVAARLLKSLTTTRLLPALVATNHAPASAPLTQTDSHKLPMTAMVVDDNLANLKLIGALLDDPVQQMILYDNDQQAVDQVKRLQMDLILMDIQMPDMDGTRVCELIHRLPYHQQTPMAAVTAHALEDQREKLLSAGMNDYLAKPIEEEKLHALLLCYQPGLLSVAPTVLPPAESAIDHNLTFDQQLALHQTAMKPDPAREMLQMLIAFMPEMCNKVEEQLVGEQPEGLADLIHKLHGSCNYSGALRLKKLCHTLESQLRPGTAAEDLELELFELLDELNNMAHEVCRMDV